MKHQLFTMLLTMTALLSCSEELPVASSSSHAVLTVTDSGFIHTADVTDITGSTRTAYSGLSSSFEDGDAIGLYVVNSSHQVIKSNIRCAFDGTRWVADSPIPYVTGYRYYAYAPYTATPYSPDFSQTNIDGIFADFLTDASNKFHRADQSSKAAFQASDLMVAEGVTQDPFTVSFAMHHKKALAVFKGGGAASASFTGNIPYLMATRKYFLMKPATATSFTNEEETYTLAAQSGKYVIYNIFGRFVLDIVAPASFTYEGGTNSYSVTSYITNRDGSRTKAVPWTASYDTDGDGVFDDAQPSWLTAFTASGDGSTAATNYNATVSAQTAMTPTPESASSILQDATEVGSSTDYYDLSTNGGASSRTTANCYMVHAPGYYKLPLVYGNAIKNGLTNTDAFYPNVSTNALARFVNHAGTGITDPWLKNNGATPTSGTSGAQLIWQDVTGLTANYTIDGDYLMFQVPKASIAEGNAVIAVKSGSTIVWSWHIWVTPETYGNLTTVSTGSHNYRVTPVNLGWVGSGSVTKSGYERRSCTVRISQPGGQTETFDVTQTENITVTSVKGGNSPFYQWGRKDPFVPSNGSGNTDKTVETGLGVDSKGWAYEAATGTTTIGTNIQNPWKHYYYSSNGGPVSTTYHNMWDAKNTTTGNIATATKKTIYDPCPPGFCVPTGNLWYYFGNGTSREITTWDGTSKGATWNIGITGDALWFPVAGCRYDNSGAISTVGYTANYWSATPYNANFGHYLNIVSSGWYWRGYTRAYGFSVRPVAEE